MPISSTTNVEGFSTTSPGRQAPSSHIPPLRQGDHLSVEEFERRYEAMPEVKKAELIEGVVHMPSPVTDDYHGTPHSDLGTFLGVYRYRTPGVRASDNATLKGLGGINEPQPDSLLRIVPECQGQTRTDKEGYIVGGPELVGEIAFSTASYALHEKKEAYRKNAVQEYIVWRVEDAAIDWFRLRGDRYELLPADIDGVIKSEVFPGLWLDSAALLRGDFERVLEVLQAGLASPEHAAFVKTLEERRRT